MHSPQFSGQGCGASTQLSSCVGRLKRWYIHPQNRHFTLLYGQILLWSFSWARRNEPTQPCWHFLSEYSHCAWWLSFSCCSPLQEHPGTVHCTLILAMIACRGTEMLNWVWLIVARSLVLLLSIVNQIKMRDYMGRRVTSPSWDPPTFMKKGPKSSNLTFCHLPFMITTV